MPRATPTASQTRAHQAGEDEALTHQLPTDSEQIGSECYASQRLREYQPTVTRAADATVGLTG